MAVKVKESFEKTKPGKNNDKFKNYILRGQRNAKLHEKFLTNYEKSCKFSLKNKLIFVCLR